MSRGKRKMSDIASAHKAHSTKLSKINLGSRVWHPVVHMVSVGRY